MPDEEYPYTLTTGRRLESYNTGVQSGGYLSPLHTGEAADISPEDAEALGAENGTMVRIASRRGSVIAPVRIDPGLRRGVVFMSLHFPDDVATNLLTINATDPKSGTAEFKACAVSLQLATQTMPTATNAHRLLAAAGDD
jgi:anaerobic selenocysteine-containing dehydrogenase